MWNYHPFHIPYQNITMKTLSTLFCFIAISFLNAFGQTNPLKDDLQRTEKERKQIQKNGIKETIVYLYTYADKQPADSIIIARYNYDKNGYLTSLVNYRTSQYGRTVPPNTYTFTNLYDEHNNIIQHSKVEAWYTINSTTGEQIKMANFRFGDDSNQAVTYQYDEHNNLVKDVDHFNSFIDYGNGRKDRLGTGVTYYVYDHDGNIAAKHSHDLDSKFTYRNEYEYDSKKQLVKISTWLDSVSKEPTIRQEMGCQYTKVGLIKTGSIFVKDQLTEQKELLYDKHGNLLKGYDVNNNVRRLVWDYKYDKNDRVTESVGGPGMRFGAGFKDYSYRRDNQISQGTGGPAALFVVGSMDIRRDGLAHLFYTYDDDGNLTEIKKYERDNYGEEKLTMAQKFVYKTY